MCLEHKVDITYLERIAKKLGRFVMPNAVYMNVDDAITSDDRLKGFEKAAWKKKVELDNKAYVKFLFKFSRTDDLNQVLDEIEADTRALVKFLRKIVPGISETDASLLANAQWVRSKSHYEPLILTDDEDLLASTHLVSSFFGLSLGCFSSFEMLRLSEIEELYSVCTLHYGLKCDLKGMDEAWPKEELEKNLSSLLKKNMISCHANEKIAKLINRRD